MNANQFDLAIVHSGASNPLFIQPQVAALSAFENLPVIDVVHRSMPSMSGGFGVSRIVAVCESVAALQPGEFGNIVETIHNGIDLRPFQQHTLSKSDCRSQFGIPDHGLVVGFLGRLQEEKGAIDILKAAPAISDTVEGACFIFGGEGAEREEMQEYAEKHGINAIFPGAIPPEQKITFLKALDIMLVTSRAEGFPLVPLEAIAAGVPLVSYDIASVRELFNQFDNTDFLVSPGDIHALSDAVIKLLVDTEGRQQLARECTELSTRFSIEVTAEKYNRLITDIVAAREGRPLPEPAPVLYRYLGIMCLLKGDQESAGKSFRTAIRLDAGLQPIINNDVARLQEYYQRYVVNAPAGK